MSYASVSLARLEFVSDGFPRTGLDREWTPFSIQDDEFCESSRTCEGVAHLDRFGSLPIVGYVWLRAERLTSPLESAEWGDKMMANSSHWGDGYLFRSYETTVYGLGADSAAFYCRYPVPDFGMSSFPIESGNCQWLAVLIYGQYATAIHVVKGEGDFYPDDFISGFVRALDTEMMDILT
ncbi:hypothetical protein [Stackebrandtia soli]|uniref:hypothetical protein n=1 Tax=Stackebrandtia soli TaxID=1892856 RepID=UPI0039E87F34